MKFEQKVKLLKWFIGTVGILILGFETSFWAVVGVFLMMWANNVDYERNLK